MRLAHKLWDYCLDMEIIDEVLCPEDLEFTKHLETIIQMTAMRRFDLVRGRVDHDGSFFAVGGSEAREAKNNRLVDMLRGVLSECITCNGI